MTARHKSAPSTVTKMALGCAVGALALGVMYIAAQVVGAGQGSVLWLFGSTLLLTLAELYISPIGFSLVTKVSPAKIVSMMIGGWFLSSVFGNYMAGYIGMHYEQTGKDHFFLLLAGLSLIPAILFFACHKFLTQALGKEV